MPTIADIFAAIDAGKRAGARSARQWWDDPLLGTTDAINRGVIAGGAGMFADIPNMIINAGLARLRAPDVLGKSVLAPYIPQSIADPWGGAESIGRGLEHLGIVSKNRNSLAEIAASLIVPPVVSPVARAIGRTEEAISRATPGPVRGSLEAQRGGPKKPPPLTEAEIAAEKAARREETRQSVKEFWEQYGREPEELSQISAEGLGKAKDVRAGKRVETTGQFVGAPPGIDNQRKYNKLVNDYKNRIREAIDAGVPRGYFYERGTEANRAVTGTQAEAERLAMLEGITSSTAPVQTNVGWALKALQQFAQGAKVSSGMYPKSMQDKLINVLNEVYKHIGEKTHRYGAGLAGQRGRAPNDVHEIRSFGYEGESASPTQHAFMDKVRKEAVGRWNAEHPNEVPLDDLGGQELNWAVQRAKTEGITPAEAAETIPDAMDAYIIRHTWESRGGEKAMHLQDMKPEEWAAYHRQISNMMLDEGGKDRLLHALGSEAQLPALQGTSSYEGVTAPASVSRTLGFLTRKGLDPLTMAELRVGEGLRSLALGQDMGAGYGFVAPKGLSEAKTDTVRVNLGRQPTPSEEAQIQAEVRRVYGNDASYIPHETGFDVRRFMSDEDFAEKYPKTTFPKLFDQQIGPKLRQLVPEVAQRRHGMALGDAWMLGWGGEGPPRSMLSPYAVPKIAESPATQELLRAMNKVAAGDPYLMWGGGNATRDLLRMIDDPALVINQEMPYRLAPFEQTPPYRLPGAPIGADVPLRFERQPLNRAMTTYDPVLPIAPRFPERADSPMVRAIMGDVSRTYQGQQAAGQLPNPLLTHALQQYGTGGLAALRDLVAKGIAPGIGALTLYDLLDPYGQERPAYQ